MEGDPKPGALVGRMSFQNCNATIDVRLLGFCMFKVYIMSYCLCLLVFRLCECIITMGMVIEFLRN
jgi:hypothetical protein